MAQPSSRFRVLSGILAVGQLGVSLIVPILLFTALGVWLSDRFGIGAWLTVLCIVVGVITAGCTFYRTAREFLARQRAEDKPCQNGVTPPTAPDETPPGTSSGFGEIPPAGTPGIADNTRNSGGGRRKSASADRQHQGGDNT